MPIVRTVIKNTTTYFNLLFVHWTSRSFFIMVRTSQTRLNVA